MDTLTKIELIDEIIMKTGLSRKEASDGLETFLEMIKETLEKGEEVTLSGFGKWSVRDETTEKGP